MKNNSPELSIKGKVRVEVYDADGKLVRSTETYNVVTNAFMRYVLYDVLNTNLESPFATRNNPLPYLINSDSSRNTTANLVSRIMPHAMGMYCLSEPSEVHAGTQIPQYVDESLAARKDAVAFYYDTPEHAATPVTPVDPATPPTVGPTTEWDEEDEDDECEADDDDDDDEEEEDTSDPMVMLPVPPRSFWEYKNIGFTTMYKIAKKATGTIQSVHVGRDATIRTGDNFWYTSILPVSIAYPTRFEYFRDVSSPYLLEHQEHDTIIYKRAISDPNKVYRLSLASLSSVIEIEIPLNDIQPGVTPPSPLPLQEIITSDKYSGGFVIGDNVWKAVKVGIWIEVPAGGRVETGYAGCPPEVERPINKMSAILHLLYVHTIDNPYPEEGKIRIEIVIPPSMYQAVDFTSSPVMVYKPETDTLEIFLTLTNPMKVNGKWGVYLYKVTLNNMKTFSADKPYTVSQAGFVTYYIACTPAPTACVEDEETFDYSWTKYNNYWSGWFFNTQYYFAYSKVLNPMTGVWTRVDQTTSPMPGIITGGNLAVQDKFIAKTPYGRIPFGITDCGLVQFTVDKQGQIEYVWPGEVLSAANIPTIVKKAGETMLVFYTYYFDSNIENMVCCCEEFEEQPTSSSSPPPPPLARPVV